MKGKVNQRAVTKPGAKKAIQTSRLKPVDKISPPKVRLKKVRTLSQAMSRSLDDKDLLAIIEVVRMGIAFNEFEKIVVETPFSMAEWANYLQLSERTIQRNQKERKAFQPIQSERIVKLVMLYNYGVEVFGDKENFNVWLDSRSIALGGRTPKELLDTLLGVGMIKDELGRIEHGVLA